ncbi:uncharacterized protein BDV17DRAFT_252740 [Aspergillus undulatus]|uniref:uncharacterized protein n=1 Tax=Aspergillus undulatus TaxID=1810928 RepID=UPI003CCCC87E
MYTQVGNMNAFYSTREGGGCGLGGQYDKEIRKTRNADKIIINPCRCIAGIGTTVLYFLCCRSAWWSAGLLHLVAAAPAPLCVRD